MDLKHRTAYMRIKQTGVADETLFNEGESIALLLPKLMRHLMHAPNRYGRIMIELDFVPFTASQTEQEKHLAEIMAGIDLSAVEMESPEDAALWDSNPMNPANPNYDPLYQEYQNCYITSHRSIKTPEDLALLRKHVESKYAGTRWWDGSHKW